MIINGMSALGLRCQCEFCRADDWEVISGEKRAAFAELIDAVQPFATFNGSEPTITVRTPDITRLRAALARFGAKP